MRYMSMSWKGSIFYIKWYDLNYNCDKVKTYILIHRTAKKYKEVQLKSQYEFKMKF